MVRVQCSLPEFGGGRNLNAPSQCFRSPMAEAAGLEPVKCEFDPHRKHHGRVGKPAKPLSSEGSAYGFDSHHDYHALVVER